MMIKEVNSEDEMKAFGKALGQSLKGGEIIELIGDVGSGKTTFAKGVALGLEIHEYIQSPSFTINRSYDGRNSIKLSHYDFYRLDKAGIMANELNEEINDKTVVTIIEWAGIVDGVLPSDRLSVNIDVVNENSRKLTLKSNGHSSDAFIRKIMT